MQMQHTSSIFPTWAVVLLIALGGLALASAVRGRLWESLSNWKLKSAVLGCLAFVLAIAVLGTYQVKSRTQVQTRLHDVQEMGYVNASTMQSRSDVNFTSHFALPRFPWQFSPHHSAGRVLVDTWILIGVALVVILGVAGVLRWATRKSSVSVNVDRASNSSLSVGWLTVPALCLGVLGYLARPALLPSTDHDLPRKSQALAEQQLHTEKVLREVRDGSTLAGPDAPPIPDWLKNGVVTSSQFLLSSGQFSSVQEAENQLLPHAAYLLQRAFQENHPWEGMWTVPLAEIRERVVDNVFIEQGDKTIGKFSGKIYRVHMRVDVSPRVCETFTSAWKSQIVRHRLEVLGVLLGWITCCFFAATLYFRRAAHPENFVGWWGQLKVSAVTLGLTAAAAWVLVDVIG